VRRRSAVEEAFMLPRFVESQIRASDRDYIIGRAGILHARVLSRRSAPCSTAVFVHNGAGANHTTVERPSRWLMAQGLFDRVILPDRRGCGASSPLTTKFSAREHAEDLKVLLDIMEVDDGFTAIGLSDGGIVALILATIDPRVERVVLVAASPILKKALSVGQLRVKQAIRRSLLHLLVRIMVGRSQPEYTDFDDAYEHPTRPALWRLYVRSLTQTSASRRSSYLTELDSTLDGTDVYVPEQMRVDVPVLQVIGERDEVFRVGLTPQCRQVLPNFRRTVIPRARHKDVFARAGEFYGALAGLLKESSAPQWFDTSSGNRIVAEQSSSRH
jgi:pimeloyl-ACP methyl ester carboxylesterase